MYEERMSFRTGLLIIAAALVFLMLVKLIAV